MSVQNEVGVGDDMCILLLLPNAVNKTQETKSSSDVQQRGSTNLADDQEAECRFCVNVTRMRVSLFRTSKQQNRNTERGDDIVCHI